MRFNASFYFKAIYITLVALCFNIKTIYAQGNIPIVNEKSSYTALDITNNNINELDASTTNSDIYTYDPESYVLLYIDNDAEPFINYTFTLELNMTSQLADGTDGTTELQTLVVQFNPIANTGTNDDQAYYRMMNSYGVKVNVVSVSTLNNETNVTTATVPDNIKLDLGFKAIRYTDISQSSTPSFTFSNTNPSNSSEYLLEWSPVNGALSYDLEWTWIDTYENASATITEQQFKNNSTRVNTSNVQYEIPNLYDQGKLFCRVRAISRFPQDFTTNYYGSWTAFNVITIATGHEFNKNWQFQASYAEDGKQKAVVSYFDGTLRNRQTVTKINSDDNAIVGEVIYDNQGRPAIEVLPVPTGTNELLFYNNFNRPVSDDSRAYSHLDFDWDSTDIDACEINLDGMSTINGASKYYSNQYTAANTLHDFVPNANNYPFSQIEYTPDNTGRIKRKSGVGNMHQLGTGHEMKYIYAKPFQDELDRLFGSNVGWDAHYKKNAVVDPNGQVSVSYIDPQGRTIATALVADNPFDNTNNVELLQGLDDEQGVLNMDVDEPNAPYALTHADTNQDLLNKQNANDFDTILDNNDVFNSHEFVGFSIYDALVYESVKPVLSNGVAHAFNYNLKINGAFEPNCFVENTQYQNTGYPFVFDLQLNATDDCGEPLNATQLPINNYVDGGAFNLSTYDGSSVSLISTSSVFDITPSLFNGSATLGSLNIYKQLKVNKDALNIFADDYIEKAQEADCIFELSDFIPNANNSGCYLSCEDCVKSFFGFDPDPNTGLYPDIDIYDETIRNTALQNYIDEQLAPYIFLDDSMDAETILAFEARFTREFELVIEACMEPCQVDGVTFNENDPTNTSSLSCGVIYDMLVDDVSKIGQYGFEDIIFEVGEELNDTDGQNTQVLEAVSLFNENNSLHTAFAASIRDGGSLPANPYSWKTPYHPNYSGDDAKHYFESDGSISKVEVQFVEGVWTPDFDQTNTSAELGDDDLFYVEPQFLINVEDFVAAWRPYWANSLVIYHPEYCYVEYAEIMCSVEGSFSVDASSTAYINIDGFISLLNGFTFDQANGYGFFDLTSQLNIMNSDPFFSNDIPSGLGLANNTEHQIIMQEALLTNFDETNKNLIERAFSVVGCNSIQDCSLPVDFNGLTADEKEMFWESYRGYYLSLRRRIYDAYAHSYALANDCYNGCIGGTENDNPNLGLNAMYSVNIPQTGFPQGTGSLCGDNEDLYITKEKRYITSDALYDSNDSVSDVFDDLNASTTYDYYVQTGSCPLVQDLQIFLNGLATEKQVVSGVEEYLTLLRNGQSFTGNYLTLDLFSEMGGNPASTSGALTIETSISTNVLTLNVKLDSQNYDPIVLTLPASVNLATGTNWQWGDHVTPSNDTGFIISGISNLQYSGTYTENPLAFNFACLATVYQVNQGVVSNNFIDLVLTGTTSTRIGECFINGEDGVAVDNGGNPIGEEVEGVSGSAEFCDELDKLGFVALIPEAFLSDTERVSIADDLVGFVNSIVLDPNYENNLVVTHGYRQTSGSGTNFRSKQLSTALTIAQTFDDILINDAQPAQIFHIQKENYSNSFRRLADAFTNDTTDKTSSLDIIYVLITADQYVDINAAKAAYDNLIASGKTNKVFFILQKDLLTIRDTEPNPDVLKTPFNYVKDIVGNPIAYTPSLGIQNSDYIEFTKADLLSVANPLESFLVNTFPEIANDSEKECITCIPQTLPVVSHSEKHEDYIAFMNPNNDGFSQTVVNFEIPEFYSSEYFYNLQYGLIVDGYISYLTVLGVTSVEDSNFITLPDFGATGLHYGYNDYTTVILEYETYLNATTDNPKYSWVEFVSSYLSDNIDICPPAMVNQTINTQIDDPTPDCVEFYISVTEAYGEDNYAAYIERLKRQFKIDYTQAALSSVIENFHVEYADKEYQYTLYYYDQAGNLTQTVPPQGVRRTEFGSPNYDVFNQDRNSTNETVTATAQPDHKLKTEYQYNSLNQLIWQSTPDGGITRFAYDELGRIIASQNAEQVTEDSNNDGALHQYSYTRYDGLGRIIEAGEIENYNRTASSNYRISAKGELLLQGERVNSFDAFYDDLLKRQVTKTVYDEGLIINDGSVLYSDELFTNYLEAYVKYNSINRITAVLYYDEIPANGNPKFDNGLFYNYDVHGNVKELVTYITELKVENCIETAGILDCETHVKRVSYDYDLISGNVNQVVFQKDKPDQFIHAYAYDADNRIVSVHTSRDDLIWEEDATYTYYEHGPLARTELGDKKVQGLDFVYTLQGWLKSVNGESLSSSDNDIGTDGTGFHSNVAKDAFGYALHYFDNDYNSVANSNNAFLKLTESNLINSNGSNLYNGNIKTMITALRDKNEVILTSQANQYSYDQLNRIKSMNSLAVTDNSLNALSTQDSYASTYSYDRNGNLQTLTRDIPEANGLTNMDDFEYKYREGTNQLLTVIDNAPTNGFDDIENQLDQLGQPAFIALDEATHNYVYDDIGQLIEDKTENLKISWRVDGKVDRIEKELVASTQITKFMYDGLGNRLGKSTATLTNNIMSPYNKTIYSRDAQGNVLGVYEKIGDFDVNTIEVLDINVPLENGLVIDDQGTIAAQHTITVASIDPSDSFIYTIDEPNGKLKLVAGETIRLMPGFRAKSGSTFSAEIGGAPQTDISSFKLKEHHIYGSSRLGLQEDNIALLSSLTAPPEASSDLFTNLIGDKRYELSNHLGNVLSVITDKKIKKVDVNQPLYNDTFTTTLASWTPSVNTQSIALDNNRLKIITGTDLNGANGYYDLEQGKTYLFSVNVDKSEFTPELEFGIWKDNSKKYSEFIEESGIVSTTYTPTVNGTFRLNFRLRQTGYTGGAEAFYIDDVLIIDTTNTEALSEIEYFMPDVIAYNDYYPFGMLTPNRNGSAGDYRYGFQGQEKDDEIKGEGNSLNYMYRMYDSRIGRFFAADPLESKYPYYTPYQFSGNRLIDMKELEGLEPKEAGKAEGEVASAMDTEKANASSYGIRFPEKWVWHEGGIPVGENGDTSCAGWYAEKAYANMIKPMAISFAETMGWRRGEDLQEAMSLIGNPDKPDLNSMSKSEQDFFSSRNFADGYSTFLYQYGSHVINQDNLNWQKAAYGNTIPMETSSPFFIFGGALKNILTPKNYVYRVVRPDENIKVGLFAKNPNATYKIEGHVLNGSRDNFKSQFISTTKDLKVAKIWAEKSGNRIIRIDMKYIKGKVHDISTKQAQEGALKGNTAKNFAEKSKEVLIEGSVSPKGLKVIKN